MSRKSEIKVYLPTKLVGELESRKRAGIRSKFIEEAIRKRLKKEEEFDIWDIPKKEIYKMARVFALQEEDTVLHTVLTDRLEALQ